MITIEEFLELDELGANKYLDKVGVFSNIREIRSISQIKKFLDIKGDRRRWYINHLYHWGDEISFIIQYFPGVQLKESGLGGDLDKFPMIPLEFSYRVRINFVSITCLTPRLILFYGKGKKFYEPIIECTNIDIESKRPTDFIKFAQEMRIKYQGTIGEILDSLKNNTLKTDIEEYFNLTLGKAPIPYSNIRFACNRFIEIVEEEDIILEKGLLYILILCGNYPFIPVPLKKVIVDVLGEHQYSIITLNDLITLEEKIANYCYDIHERVYDAEKEFIKRCKDIKKKTIFKYGIYCGDLDIKVNDKDIL